MARTRSQTLRAYVHYIHPVCTRGNPFAMAVEVTAARDCVSRKHRLYTFLALHPESGTLNLLRETRSSVTRAVVGEGRRERGDESATLDKSNATDSATIKIKGIKMTKKMDERRGGEKTRVGFAKKTKSPTLTRRVDRGLNTKSGTGIPSSSTGGAVAYCVNINKYS